MPPVAKPIPVAAPKKGKAPPAKKVEVEDLPATGPQILYPEVVIKLKSGPDAITPHLAASLLNWEDEEAYKARVGDEGAAGYGDEYILVDKYKRKVQCWNNLGNRPFSEPDSLKYAQDILTKNWAGPTSMPGETVNGETVVIGRTGQVISGQHRLIALVLAKQMWEQQPLAWKQYWPTEPVLETILVLGVSEADKVVRTADNVKTRTLADTVYTSDIFKVTKDGKPRKMNERRELSKMLDTAIDMLWRRTKAGDDPIHHYQTHSTSFDFLDKHQRLNDCVKHLFEENSERALTKMRLSAGHCAALMYLQAASGSDIDLYLGKHSEEGIDWKHWEKAEEFWVLLAGEDESFKPVVERLGLLVDEDTGTGGRNSEKHSILIKAWNLFVEGQEMTVDNLALDYVTDELGIVTLDRPWPTLGGIDQGDPAGQEAEIKLTKDQIEEARALARAEKTAKQEEKIKAKKTKDVASSLIAEQVAELHDLYPDRVLIFRGKQGDYNAFCEDAETLIAKVKAKPVKRPDGVKMVTFAQSDFEPFIQVMQGLGDKIAVCVNTANGVEVTDIKPRVVQPARVPKEEPVKKAPAPAAKPAPAKGGKKAPLRGGTGS